MKLRSLLVASVLCSLSTGVGAYALTPARLRGPAVTPTTGELAAGAGTVSGQDKGAPAVVSAVAAAVTGEPSGASAAPAAEPWRIQFDGALVGSMTLGNTTLASGAAAETLILLEMHGSQLSARQRTPVHLSLVLDRSGSMEGMRWRSALEAAVGALKLLADGDTFSLVSFGDTETVEIAPVVIDEQTRAQAEKKIRATRLGGDTCVSCGLEASRKLLATTPDKVRRMILLSDGEANMGLMSPSSFLPLAGRVRDEGATLATVGLGSYYNEKLLTALSVAGNGTVYNVASESGLAQVFEAEARGLQSIVARDAKLELELGDGVELVKVYERSFQREGSRLIVPLGAVQQGERKVVLASVKVPAGASGQVAQARLKFQDLTRSAPGLIEGPLAVARAEASSEPLPAVARWALGSQTSEVIGNANSAFARGKTEEAKREAEEQLARLKTEVARAEKLRDEATSALLKAQARKVENARKSYDMPAPAAPAALKKNYHDIRTDAAY